MKKTLGIILSGVFILTQAVGAFAATKSTSFTVKAKVPVASSINIDAYQKIGDAKPSALPGTELSFGTLTLDSKNNIYKSDRYFILQVAPQGAGNLTTVVKYEEVAKPTGATRGLGDASTATFTKAVEGSENETTIGTAAKLSGLNRTIHPADIAGGWLKIYIGLATGSETMTGLAPFSGVDKPGDYSGTVTITATVS